MRVRVEVRAREMHAATDDGVTPILGGDVRACIDARPRTSPSRVPGCLWLPPSDSASFPAHTRTQAVFKPASQARSLKLASRPITHSETNDKPSERHAVNEFPMHAIGWRISHHRNGPRLLTNSNAARSVGLYVAKC